jgi:hypothetical protein
MVARIKSLVALIFLLTVFFTTSAAAELYVAVDSLKGSAEVQRAGRQQWQKAEKKMKLYNNDIIHVLPEGFASLSWPDGSQTFVHQNSQMLINLVAEQPPKDKIFSHATVFFGAVFFLVKKIAPRGLFDDSDMRVYTPTAVMSIRGTAFSVGVDKNTGATTLQVVSGTVQIRNILKTVSLFLGPAYRTTVSLNNDPLPPAAVLKTDLDSLKLWIPATIISEVMEKQVAQTRKDNLVMSGKLEDKCVIALFANNSNYHGPWPITKALTKALTSRLSKVKPKLRFIAKDSLENDPFIMARKDSARFVILGSIEVFDITQHAEISPRADEYREYANAEVRLRLRLLDAASGKQLAEEVYGGEIANKNALENSWQKVNKLKFDLADEKFAASILGIALNQSLEQASRKIVKYIE